MSWLRIKNFSKFFLSGITIIILCEPSPNFSKKDNGKILNRQKLAEDYFGSDAQWYLRNIPFFESSDKKIQDVYYYRWKLFKAHIRDVGQAGYVITEFLDKVSWDKEPYSSLNDATAFHIYEGRWLKDRTYINGYINYMYRGGGNDRHFSEGIADAAYAYYLVNADSSFVESQLSVMQHVYNLWLDHYDLSKCLYYIEPLLDATEYTISSVDASGGKDGFTGGDAFRSTINSYMYGNALAISHIARMKGDTTLSRIYLKRAESLKTKVQNDLWNDSLHHFIDRYKVSNRFVHYWNFIRGRELAGYVPWDYNLPDNNVKFNTAWVNLMDTTKFLGKYGLRTVEPSYQYYMRQYRYAGTHPECQWNGPSWPFQETQVLRAMANLLNNYEQHIISPSDYLKLLRLYTGQHYLPDGQLNLQEDYNPDTGKPIVGLYRSSHYNHSSYCDLIITGLCGLRPAEGNHLVINPIIDSSIKYFCLEGVPYHGHSISVVYDSDGKKYNLGKGFTAFVDGKESSLKMVNGKYELTVGPPVVFNPVREKDLALNIWENSYPKPSSSINSESDSLYQAIDGRTWYFPEIKNRWSTYGSKSSSDWYALDFGKAEKISKIKLYFLADKKSYEAPDNFTVEFRNENGWEKVNEISATPEKPIGNSVNEVDFETVTAKGIKFIFKNEHKKYSIALAEIKVF